MYGTGNGVFIKAESTAGDTLSESHIISKSHLKEINLIQVDLFFLLKNFVKID